MVGLFSCRNSSFPSSRKVSQAQGKVIFHFSDLHAQMLFSVLRTADINPDSTEGSYIPPHAQTSLVRCRPHLRHDLWRGAQQTMHEKRSTLGEAGVAGMVCTLYPKLRATFYFSKATKVDFYTHKTGSFLHTVLVQKSRDNKDWTLNEHLNIF